MNISKYTYKPLTQYIFKPVLTHVLKPVYKRLFKPSQRIQKLIDELEQSSISTRKFIKDFDPMIHLYCSIRQTVCLSCGLLYWEKDAEHRYTKANAAHCTMFYGIPAAEFSHLLGKTDIELITEYRLTGQHSYGDLCYSTDEFMKLNLGRHRFFEFGSKDGVALTLDVTKEALLDVDGTFIGTKGYAVNMSSREKDALVLLFKLIKDKMAWRLDPGTDQKVAAYYIKDLTKCLEGKV